MSAPVSVLQIDDLLVSAGRCDVRDEPAGVPLELYAPEGFSERDLVFRNGRRAELDEISRPGDLVKFVRVPGAFLGLGAAAGAAGGAAAITGTQLFTTAILLAGVTAIQIGLSQGSAAPGVRLPNPPEPEINSPTRGDRGLQNTRGSGRPLAIVYGEHRVAGHIFDEFIRPLAGTAIGGTDQTTVTRSEIPAVTGSIYKRIALAEGPIESIDDIEFDETGIASVRGVTYQTSLGQDDHLAGDRAPHGFDQTRVPESVDQAVTKAGGAVTHTTAEAIDAFELTLRWPNGFFVTSNGIPRSVTIELKVEYRVDDAAASWTTLSGANIRVSDLTVAASEYRIYSGPLARSKYQIRVTRISDDDDLDPLHSITEERHDFTFKTLERIVFEERTHPQVAWLALEHVITDQESQLIPATVTSLVKGWRKCRIYTDTTTYTEAWTNNPAWVTADFIANERFGSGRFFNHEDNLNLAEWIAWASYCDELVPDGRGGSEKRCQCDIVIDVTEDHQTIRTRLAFAGDAVLIDNGGRWGVSIDRPSPVEDVFSQQNMIEGTWRYGWVPEAELASQLTGIFNNSEQGYRRDSITRENDNLASATGLHAPGRDVQCFGIVRETQVNRTLYRQLRHNEFAIAECSFESDLEGITANIGSVIKVAIPGAGVGLSAKRLQRTEDGGRRLYLDDEIELEAGKFYEIEIRHNATNARETQIVTTSAGKTDVVEVPDHWTESIGPGDAYAIGELGNATKTFRVTHIERTEKLTTKITARIYDERIYDLTGFTSASSELAAAPVNPGEMPGAVVDLTAKEFEPNGNKSIVLGWLEPATGRPEDYQVWSRRTDYEDFYSLEATVQGRTFTMHNVFASDNYTIVVVARGPSGNRLSLDEAASTTVATTA